MTRGLIKKQSNWRKIFALSTASLLLGMSIVGSNSPTAATQETENVTVSTPESSVPDTAEQSENPEVGDNEENPNEKTENSEVPEITDSTIESTELPAQSENLDSALSELQSSLSLMASGEGCSYADPGSGEYAETLCWLDLAGLTTEYEFVSAVDHGRNSFYEITYQSVLGTDHGLVTVRGENFRSADQRKNSAWEKLSETLYRSSGSQQNGTYYGPVKDWPIEVELSGGYILKAKINISAEPGEPALAVHTVPFPTWSGAFLGNNNFYTGVNGKPAIYQSAGAANGTVTTASLDEVSVTRNGMPVDGYSIVVADAESTDNGERIDWSTSGGSGFSWLPNNPTAWKNASNDQARKLAAVGNACRGTNASDFADADRTAPLTPNCYAGSSGQPSPKTGTAMLQVSPQNANTPFNVTQKMKGGGLQGVAFGVLTASARANVVVADRIIDELGEASTESFQVTLARPGSDLVASAENDDLAATTDMQIMPVNSEGTQLNFSSQVLGGFADSYTPEWICTKTGEPDGWGPSPTPPPLNDEWFKLFPSQFIDCTVTYTPPYITLAKDVINDGTDAVNEANQWELTAVSPGLSNVSVRGDSKAKIAVAQGTYTLGESDEPIGEPPAWQYGYDWTGLRCESNPSLADGEFEVVDGENNTVQSGSVVVNKGSIVVCNFENTARKPHLETQKQVFDGLGQLLDWADPVNAGDEVRYKLSFDNSTGSAPMKIEYIDHLFDVLDDAEFVHDSVRISNGSEVGYPDESDSGLGITVTDELDASNPKLVIDGTVPRAGLRTVWFAVRVLPNSSNSQNRTDYTLNNYLVRDGEQVPDSCEEPTEDTKSNCTHNPIPAWTMSKSSRPASGARLHKGGNVHYQITAEKKNSKTNIENLVFQDDLTHVFKTAGWAPNASVPGGALKRGIYFFSENGESLDSNGVLNSINGVSVPAFDESYVPAPVLDVATNRWLLTSVPVNLPANAIRAELWFAVEAANNPAQIPESWSAGAPEMGAKFVNYVRGTAQDLNPNECSLAGTAAPDTSSSPYADFPADPSFPDACQVQHQLSANFFTIRKDASGVGLDLPTAPNEWGDPTGLTNLVGHQFEIRDEAGGTPSKYLCRKEYNPSAGWNGTFISDVSNPDWGEDSETLAAILAYNNSLSTSQTPLPLCGLFYPQGTYGGQEHAGGQDGRWRSENLPAGDYWLIETKAPDKQINASGTASRDIPGVQLLAQPVQFRVWPEEDGPTFGDVVPQQSMEGRGQLDIADQPRQRCSPSAQVGQRPVACVNPTGYLMIVKDTVPMSLPLTGGVGTTAFTLAGVGILVFVATMLWLRRTNHPLGQSAGENDM